MINQANNFFSEIEYYESRGNYVLADKLTKSFLKIAYQANISDIGKDYSEAFADKFSLDVIYHYASLIPECLEAGKSDPNLLPFLAKDYKDLIYEKTQSGKDVDSAAYEAAVEMETSYEQRMNLDQFIKGDKDLAYDCIEKISKIFGQESKESKNLDPANPANSKNPTKIITPASRAVPTIPAK